MSAAHSIVSSGLPSAIAVKTHSECHHSRAADARLPLNEQTKDRIRYLAALTDATQADIVHLAVSEYAVRHADDIARGIERAREGSQWWRRRDSRAPSR